MKVDAWRPESVCASRSLDKAERLQRNFKNNALAGMGLAGHASPILFAERRELGRETMVKHLHINKYFYDC